MDIETIFGGASRSIYGIRYSIRGSGGKQVFGRVTKRSRREPISQGIHQGYKKSPRAHIYGLPKSS